MARKKRSCTAPNCTNKISAAHYLCSACLNRVPDWMTDDFFRAYKASDAMALLDITKRIREFLNRKQEKPRDYYENQE